MGIIMLWGHFLGDYLFQTSKMASNKNKPGKLGWIYAIYHGFVYTCFVSGMLIAFNAFTNLSQAIFFSIFTWITHSTIDHYSLAKKWSTMMQSDTLPDFKCVTISEYKLDWTAAEVYKMAFNSFVYIVVDNTLHITLQGVFLIILGVSLV